MWLREQYESFESKRRQWSPVCVINELQTAGVKLLFSGSVLLLPRFEARHYVTGTVERWNGGTVPRGVAFRSR